ncbi:MAG: flagellar biosynthetic protein FliR [Bacteriovoracaceae bacterium]|nr:flagellar biosynthetic protein FliR [Bacteriovoracaceae bacterium]
MRIEIVDNIQLMAFWISFSRVLTIIFQLPLWEDVAIPMIIKILSSLIITYTFFPHVSPYVVSDMKLVGENHMIILTVYYALTGLLIGYLVKNITITIMAAGTLASQQMGLGSVALFDPTSMVQVGPIEKLLKWALLMTTFSAGVMLPMLKGIFLSFSSLSWQSASHLTLSMDFFLDFFKDLFLLALMLASPIIFINILLNLVLGVVGRFVPQLNIIAVSFSVNILAGFIVLMVASSEMITMGGKYYTDYMAKWFQILNQ